MPPIAECVECHARSEDVGKDEALAWAEAHMTEGNPPGTKTIEKKHTHVLITGDPDPSDRYGYNPLSRSWIYPGQPDAEKYGLEESK